MQNTKYKIEKQGPNVSTITAGTIWGCCFQYRMGLCAYRLVRSILVLFLNLLSAMDRISKRREPMLVHLHWKRDGANFQLQGVPKSATWKDDLFFLNMKIKKFEMTLKIIMWSNLLCVTGFFFLWISEIPLTNYSKFTKASQKHLWQLSVIRTCTLDCGSVTSMFWVIEHNQ